MSETHDSQGREVFTVHPEILAGGAGYRVLKTTRPATKDGRDEATRRGGQQPKTTS